LLTMSSVRDYEGLRIIATRQAHPEITLRAALAVAIG